MNDNRIKKVGFADEKIKKAFYELENGRFEEKQLKASLDKAIIILKENPFAGIKVPKKEWPKEYVKKYAIDNLQRYALDKKWRLIYTLQGNQIEIISIILEWFTHKEYEKRFNYKVR